MGNKKSYLKVKALTERDKLTWPSLTRLHSNELLEYKRVLENYCTLYITILNMRLDCDMSAQTQSIVKITYSYMEQLTTDLNIDMENSQPFDTKTPLQKIFKLWHNDVKDFSQLNKIGVSDIVMFYNSAVISLVNLELNTELSIK